MSTKTEDLKARLRPAAPGSPGRDALTHIERQEKQLQILEGFASWVHGFFLNLDPDIVPTTISQPVTQRLRATRNDLKRNSDPDDEGCCGG